MIPGAGGHGPDPGEIERLREAFAGDDSPVPHPERCPTPEAILSAVRGELSQHEIRSIVEHTAACPTCAEEWRLAVAFEEEGKAPAAEEADPRRSRVGRPRWYDRLPAAAAAAAAVLVLALGVQRGWKPEPGKPPVQRGGVATGIRPVSPPRQSTKDCVLRWEWPEHPDATYHVEVFEPGGDRVAEADVDEPEYPLCSKLRDFPPGTYLLWQVTPAPPPGSGTRPETPETFDLILR